MRQAELLGCPDLFKINADNNRIRELDVVRSLDRARLLSSSPHLTSSSSPLTSFRLLPSHLLSSRLVPSPLLSSSSPLFSHPLSSPIPSAAIPTKPRLAQPVARAQEYLAQMTSLRKLYLANNELPDAPGIGAALIRSELVPPPPLSPPLLSSHLISSSSSSSSLSFSSLHLLSPHFTSSSSPPPLLSSPHLTSSHLFSLHVRPGPRRLLPDLQTVDLSYNYGEDAPPPPALGADGRPKTPPLLAEPEPMLDLGGAADVHYLETNDNESD